MKKTIKRFVPSMLVLLELAVVCGCSSHSKTTQSGTTLRLHPEQGKTYAISSKASILQMIDFQGQTANVNQTTEFNQSFSVKNVTDEQSDYEAQVESVKLSISQGGMILEYDSEHPEKANPMLASQTKEFDKIIKKPATLSYNAFGEMVSEKEDLSLNSLGNAIIKLPKEDICVGSSWQNTGTASASDMEFSVEYTYTVTAISKKSIDVKFTGTILKNASNISGNYNGTASFNPNTGIIMSSNTKSNVSLTVSQQGMTLPMTMAGTTIVTVTEK